MPGQIQIGGLASGLDTSSIISALVQAEAIPIGQLQSQKSQTQSKLSLIGTLDGNLSKLKTLAAKLADAPNFLKNTVKIQQEGIASFDSNGGTGLGSYSLEVLSLAAADRYSFSPQADKAADLGGAQIDFDYNGESFSISLGAGESSLEDVAAAINESAGGKVKANVIQAGTTNDPKFTLVLEGESTGVDFAIQNLTVTSGTPGFAVNDQLSTASNAVIKLNNLTIERESNQITGAVPGLTINLEGVTTEPTEFSVGLDSDAIVATLKDFVSAYNAVTSFIAGQSQFSEDDGPSGALFGDSILRTVGSTIRTALFGSQNVDSTSSFGSLGLLGISLGGDGSLTLDETKAKAKLAEDPLAFEDFFVDLDGFDNGGAAKGTAGYYTDTTADSGIFSQLSKSLGKLLDKQVTASGASVDGLLSARKKALQTDIKRFDDNIVSLQDRLADFEDGLVQKFANLEQVLSGLQSQQSYLSAFNF